MRMSKLLLSTAAAAGVVGCAMMPADAELSA
jgi:hypothetical protein